MTIKDVEKVAELAKLEFTLQEKTKLARHLDQIVTYVAKLNELDTENVQPSFNAIELKSVFRGDRVETWLRQRDALANAPAQKHGYFSVPKVLG